MTPPSPSTPPTPRPVRKPSGLLVRFGTDPSATAHRLLHDVLAHLDRAGAPAAHAAGEVAPFAVGLVLLAVAVLVAQRRVWRSGGHFVAIAPPATPDPRGGLACWRMLAPLLSAHPAFGLRRPPVAFECRGDEDGLSLGVWVSKTLSAESIAETVESAWSGARAIVTDPPEVPAGRVAVARVRLGAPEWFALGGTDPTDGDALRAVFAALVDDTGGTRACFQVLTRPASGRRVLHARAAALALRRGESNGSGASSVSGATGSLVRFVAGRSAPTRSVTSDPLAQSDVRVVTGKVNDAPHFDVAIRCAVAGGTRRQRRRRLRQLTAALGLFTGRNRLVARFVLIRPRTRIAARRLGRGFLCSAPELAALAHLPSEPSAYGMAAAPSRTIAPPRDIADGSKGRGTDWPNNDGSDDGGDGR